MRNMEDEMEVFSDLDKLRNEADRKRRLLELQNSDLTTRSVNVKTALQSAQEQQTALKV